MNQGSKTSCGVTMVHHLSKSLQQWCILLAKSLQWCATCQKSSVVRGALLGKKVFSGVLTCALHLYANCCIKRWVDECNISHGVVDIFCFSGIEVLRAALTFSAKILRHFIS